ncbi:MAG TPA: invasion associated locus B family protein [Candidatus Rubrimentiphilum sp.]|nr:invasion associated locus B family protein [Candidatus Rubrimentiphilum sp.]
MRLWLRPFAASAAALLTGVISLGAASAQTAYSSSGWRVECSPAAAGKSMDCQAVAQVTARQTGQVFVSVTVRVPAATKKPVLLIQIPLGMLVSGGVNLTIGSGTAQPYAIQTCTVSGCFIGGEVSPAMLRELLASQQLKVTFQNLDKQTVTATIPLAGFEPAYKKIQ